MGAHNRTTIKADIIDSQSTGQPPEVRAIESYVKNTYVLTMTAPIPSTQSRTVYLYPASGVIYQIKALNMKAEAIVGGFIGDHEIRVFPSINTEVLLGVSAHNSVIVFEYSYWFVANITQEPTQEVSQRLALDALIGTLISPVSFTYTNNSNGSQNTNVSIYIVTREGVL